MIAAPDASTAILVVEDSSFNRLVLRKRLAELGYPAPTEAEDGVAGLAAIENGRFDVVLLDLEMPHLDGIGVLERLHAKGGTAPPVIVISALNEVEKIVRCIELGAEDYLPKSFDPPLLRARLGAVLEKKRLRDLADLRLSALEAELASARDAQISLVPRGFAAIVPPGLALHAAMIPARQVGGDLYDALRLGPDLLLACVADVSGKGAPAGLTMARTVGLMRSTAAALAAGGGVPDPAAILVAANADLARDNDAQTFVTVVLAVVDGAGQGRIALAGHDPPFRLGPAPGGIATVTGLTRQPPLGTMEDFPYASNPLSLSPGEGLFLFSDGVTEAEDRTESFYGRNRLAETLAPHAAATPDAVVRAVLDSVDAFAAGAPQADDVTVLALRRT